MNVPILVTVIMVSIDAIFVGMSLGAQKGYKTRYSLIIASIIFFCSLVSFFIAIAVKQTIHFNSSQITGIAFTLLGIKNLFSKDEEKGTISLGSIVILGFVMSIDAVVATFFLTIDQMHSVLIPISAAAGHLILLLAGSYLTRYIKMSHKMHNVISASCLLLVAILNFTRVI